MNRIAAGNKIREIHGEVTVEARVERIITTADGDRKRRTGGASHNAAQFPSASDSRG